MVRKYEHGATTSEVEDEPRAWRDQLEKKTFDLRDLATCLPVPDGEVGDPDPEKHDWWFDDSDDSVYVKSELKKKGKGKANNEDTEDDDQGADEDEEEAEQEPKAKPKPKSKPKPKTKSKPKAPAKRKAKVERKAPTKRKARGRRNVPVDNGDSSSDDQNADDPVDHDANESEEEVEQEPANEGEIFSSVPTEESEGEVEQEPKDKGTAKGNAASQPKTRANVKATTKKSYSYGYEEGIDDVDEFILYGYDQGNDGSDDEYIPPTRSRKKDVTRGNGMAKGKATKTVDASGYDQSTGEFEEEVEPQGTRKSSRIATATTAAKQNTATKATKDIARAMNTSKAQGKPIARGRDATKATKDIFRAMNTSTAQGKTIIRGRDITMAPNGIFGAMDTSTAQGKTIIRGKDTTKPPPKDICGAMNTFTAQEKSFISEDEKRVKVIFTSKGKRLGTTPVELEDEMDCTENNQSADRVVRAQSKSDESKSLFVSQDSDDLIDPRDIRQEKVTPDPENPSAAIQGAYVHDFDVDVNHELSAATGSKRQASTSPVSRDQHPTKRRPRKTNNPFMESDSDSDIYN